MFANDTLLNLRIKHSWNAIEWSKITKLDSSKIPGC